VRTPTLSSTRSTKPGPSSRDRSHRHRRRSPLPPGEGSDPFAFQAEELAQAEASALSQAELDELTDKLIAAFKSVYDPEIPVDIFELGLIYRVDVSDDRDVVIDMTLTAPGCPVAGEMPGWVQDAAETVEGVRSATVNLVFEPPWDQTKMSDEAKLALNLF